MTEKKQTKEKLYINLLGDVSLTYNGNVINDRNIRSKKFWVILEYLIAFRHKDITQGELVNLLYPEGKSENPINALKTLIHRIRNGLSQLKPLNSHDLLVHSNGTYSWSKQIECVVDVEEFDKLCKKASAAGCSDDAKLSYYIKAIDLYKGDFLQKSAFEGWAVKQNTHYRELYGNIVHKSIDMLKQRGDYKKITDICLKAVKIDPFDESFYYELILSLINTDNSQEALVEYRKMSTLFYREFGITPSKEIMGLYREIIKVDNEIETDLNIIKEQLGEETPGSGPFFCEYEIFKDIYRLEVRAAARTGESVYLCLFTLSEKNGEIPSVKMLNSFMSKFRECINKSLRSGDVFAQYSVSQFLLLLPFSTFENGENTIRRVLRLFNRQYHYCPLLINYSLLPLEVAASETVPLDIAPLETE